MEGNNSKRFPGKLKKIRGPGGGAQTETAFAIPIPPIDLFFIIVDVLASRYGWSYNHITTEMYWEQVYEMYELSANMTTIEWNQEHHFQLAIHATTKESLDSWEDRPIPFPDRNWLEEAKKESEDENTPKSSPFKGLKPSFRRLASESKMTPERQKRFDYVLKRQKEYEVKRKKVLERNIRTKYLKK